MDAPVTTTTLFAISCMNWLYVAGRGRVNDACTNEGRDAAYTQVLDSPLEYIRYEYAADSRRTPP